MTKSKTKNLLEHPCEVFARQQGILISSAPICCYLRGLSGLINGSIEALAAELEAGKYPEVTPGSAWIVWLVLHVLRELRHPCSKWLSYIQMLPAPPDSLVKAICLEGPDATDLLLFRFLFTPESQETLKPEQAYQSVVYSRLYGTRAY